MRYFVKDLPNLIKGKHALWILSAMFLVSCGAMTASNKGMSSTSADSKKKMFRKRKQSCFKERQN
jgi:hypothetical protein